MKINIEVQEDMEDTVINIKCKEHSALIDRLVAALRIMDRQITVLQFLLDSACITVIRFLFFSDHVIKRMSVAKRTVGMLASVIVLTGLFAYLFDWFPIDNPMCWVSFLISFGICFVISVAVSTLKESMDNKRLEEGLQHLKEKNLE